MQIDDRAVVEAFPSTFLGVLVTEPHLLSVRRGNRSDVFFSHLVETGMIERLLLYLLPGRRLTLGLDDVTHHDDRAALVCAVTALCVAADRYTAVGDDDGWIVLPPRCFVQDWAWTHLLANAEEKVPRRLYRSPDPPMEVDQ